MLALLSVTVAFEAVWNGPWPQDCGHTTPGLVPAHFDLARFAKVSTDRTAAQKTDDVCSGTGTILH
eukprot:SAG31_NODE_19870_length_589_cov_1.687755_1_plen_65_part_01